MLQKMPFHEIMRLSLLGNARAAVGAAGATRSGSCRRSCPLAELHDAAAWAAETIASAPPLAVQGTVRSLWAAPRPRPEAGARPGYTFIAMGTDAEALRAGQESFASGRAPGMAAPLMGRFSRAEVEDVRALLPARVRRRGLDRLGQPVHRRPALLEHFWGTMRGRDKIRTWIEPVMIAVPEHYTVLE